MRPSCSGAARRRRRRPPPSGIIERAHQPDAVAIGVLGDGVARSPTGVVRPLMASMAGAGEGTRRGRRPPASSAGRGRERSCLRSRPTSRSPTRRRTPSCRTRGGCRSPARRRRAGRRSGVGVETERPIEAHRRGHVANDQIELVEYRPPSADARSQGLTGRSTPSSTSWSVDGRPAPRVAPSASESAVADAPRAAGREGSGASDA